MSTQMASMVFDLVSPFAGGVLKIFLLCDTAVLHGPVIST